MSAENGPMNSILPMVSIVLPCRNEKDNIENCVRSILSQDPPEGGFELLIVDGLSNDGTRTILNRLSNKHRTIRILDNEDHIVSTGLNRGIQHARGQIILRMDAHTEYARNYVKECIDTLVQTKADNVGGPCQAKGFSTIGQAIAAAFQNPFAVGGSKNHDVSYEGPIDTVYLGCWQRNLFAELGMFDPELVRNQDDEFNYRMRIAGKKLWQSRKIKCVYHTRETIKKLFWQYIQYSYWKVKVIKKHRRIASIRHIIPTIFILSLVFLPIFSIWDPRAWWAFISILGTYGISSLISSAISAHKSEWKLFPILPFIFATYHIAYGLGFLWGTIDLLTGKVGIRPSHKKITR